jgi:glucokinase
MALSRPFESRYAVCGNFEYYASGEGIARQAAEYLEKHGEYEGDLRKPEREKITTQDVFNAWKKGDAPASRIIDLAIEYWGMASANLVSIFNPEKIIFGGGVFGPAAELIPAIELEAGKWAQPISIKQATFELSALAGDAGVFGAARIAMKHLNRQTENG